MSGSTLHAIGAALLLVLTGRAADVVQFDVHDLLEGRAVTTLTQGRLVPWTQGIDGGGRADGYLTHAAAVANGDDPAHALPDDGVFPSDTVHPAVRLHFTNADGASPQIRGVAGAGGFAFAVPARAYRRVMVFLTSAEGPSELRFRLSYADGSTDRRELRLPDYYNAPGADDPDVFSLATNLAKWGPDGHMTEQDHHEIHGVDLHPDATKTLTSVRLEKTAPGYLVFWGATGVGTD